jgi:hypothetical protein
MIQRYLTSDRLALLRPPDSAEATFAKRLDKFVASEHVTRLLQSLRKRGAHIHANRRIQIGGGRKGVFARGIRIHAMGGMTLIEPPCVRRVIFDCAGSQGLRMK